MQRGTAVQSLAAHIPQGKLNGACCSSGHRNCGDTRQLANFFAVSLQLGAGGREFSVEAKTGEGAMHVAAGGNPLHYFLAQVAALGEVERAVLRGLLGELAVSSVYAEEGRSLKHPEPLEALRFAEDSVRVQDCLEKLRCCRLARPEFVAWDERAISMNDGNDGRAPCQRLSLECCER